MTAQLLARWGDAPIGSRGRIVRRWSDPAGRQWIRVEWGRTRDGKPIRQSYPAGVLSIHS